jgi:outer membrane protein OmpA-like peptidoglycan-associated protein
MKIRNRKKVENIWSILLICCASFSVFDTNAQHQTPKEKNIVNNPSFEETNTCPKEYGGIDDAVGWLSLNFTPDLFSTCAKDTKVGVPQNFFGNQEVNEGKNYAGLLVYHEHSPLEFIATNLTEPMIKGEKYKVSFKVSLAEIYSNYACDNIGILFTNDPTEIFDAVQEPQVKANFIIDQTKGWATISKIIVAKENYTFAVLGNFATKENVKIKKVQNAAYPASYYYMDDIQVIRQIEADDEDNFIKIVGTVKDAITKEPVEARIDFVLTEIRYRAYEESAPENGKYEFSNLLKTASFYLEVKAKGYYSQRILVKDNQDLLFVKDFYLKPSTLGSSIILHNIAFDYGKATLKQESFPELDMLSDFLLSHPNYHVEISGHTDSVGDDYENLKLSESRAKAIIDYLAKHGFIEEQRMMHKGYGKSQPVASNDTEEGRNKNRRVELKIVKD